MVTPAAVGRRKILVDTDPGVDDALALLFALRSPALEVVACTSIFGNAATPVTTANLARLLRFAERPIPIGTGATVPMLGEGHPHGTAIHGSDGLGDVGEGGHDMPTGTAYGAVQIVEAVLAQPGEITVVALGPLTNLALALALEPRLSSLVAGVVVMGGAHSVCGNIAATAEANILHDVHAADRVLAAPWPVTLVTIDVTMQVAMSADYLDALGRTGEEGAFLRAVTRFYQDVHRRRYGLDGIFGHDAVAMMSMVAPELFELAEGPVAVATCGPAVGQTVIDRRPGVGASASASVAGPSASGPAWAARPPVRYSVEVDAPALLELFRSVF